MINERMIELICLDNYLTNVKLGGRELDNTTINILEQRFEELSQEFLDYELQRKG